MNGKYVTDSYVAQVLGWDISNTIVSADIDLYIPIAEAIVDQYCETSFQYEAVVPYIFSGDATDCIFPGKFMNNTSNFMVELLDENNNTLWTYTDVLLMPNNPTRGVYCWIERRVVYDIAGGEVKQNFPWGIDNLRVTADWGFATIPIQVQFAVALVIKHLLQYRLVNEFIVSESAGGRLVQLKSLDGDWRLFVPSLARGLLGGYKNTRRF